MPPVALGLGKSSIEDKVAAFLYAIFLECGWERLAEDLDTFSSITTDMGTELGLIEFANINLNHLLPRYIVNSHIANDINADGMDASRIQLPWLFQKSVPVAGLLHCFSNMMKDVNMTLLGWDIFFTVSLSDRRSS